MIDEKKIKKMVNSHLQGTDHFLVDLAVKPVNKIFVYIDGDHGVTIDACRELNRFLETNLDREEDDFDLTVSSAGADAPLAVLRQYPQHIGRTLEIKLTDNTSLEGKLIAVNEDVLEILPSVSKKEKQKDPVSLPFVKIKEARVKLSFKK